MIKMMIRRLPVGSTAKVVGGTQAAIGLFVGSFLSLAAILKTLTSRLDSPGALDGLAWWMAGPPSILVLPLLYGSLGCLAGAFSAAVYHVVAGFLGGLEVEVDTTV